MPIRRAISTDCRALTDLMRASRAYRGPYARILEGYAINAVQVARDHIFLDEECDDLLGFYSLTTTDRPGMLELDLMFTADAAQGRGVGRRLFAHMAHVARTEGARTVRIVAHPPAEGFYLRMGAQRIGTHPPSSRVSWERPLLALDVTAADAA